MNLYFTVSILMLSSTAYSQYCNTYPLATGDAYSTVKFSIVEISTAGDLVAVGGSCQGGSGFSVCNNY